MWLFVIYFKNFILACLNMYIGLRLVDLNNNLDIAKNDSNVLF